MIQRVIACNNGKYPKKAWSIISLGYALISWICKVDCIGRMMGLEMGFKRLQCWAQDRPLRSGNIHIWCCQSSGLLNYSIPTRILEAQHIDMWAEQRQNAGRDQGWIQALFNQSCFACQGCTNLLGERKVLSCSWMLTGGCWHMESIHLIDFC